MAVNKLPEFAKNGQKNTDGLNQEDGFPVNLKPARQWFNFLFNKLTLSINKIIDEKFDKTGGEISNSVQLISDNSVLTVGNNADIGFVKKASSQGALAIGKSNSFIVKQSNKDTISKDASDTFTDLLWLDGNGVLSSLGGYKGNASSASKLQTPRKINDIDFDGTKDISISAPMRELSATNPNNALDDGFYIIAGVNIAGLYPYGILETRRGANRAIHQTYYAHMGDFRLAIRQSWDGGQNFSEWLVVGLRANTASRLETFRTVSFSGAATGSFSYDGSANSSCILTLSNSGVVAGTYASTVQIPSITVNEKGQITGISQQTIRSASATQAGIVQLNNSLTSDSTDQALTAAQGKKLQDEKFAKTGGEISNSVQLISDNSVLTVGNNADIGFVKKSLFKGAVAIGKNNSFTVVQSNNLTISKDASDTFTTLMNLDGNGVLWSTGGYLGNSSTASKLQTPRKIFGQDFDGSSDVSGNITANTGMLLADSYHYIDMGRSGSDRMNFNVYSGVFNFINAQNGSIVARLNSNGIDCNAATASRLQNPRMINGVNFDGTGDINIASPMRFLGIITSSNVNQALNDGFYLVGEENGFNGLYGYGVLEVRSTGGTVNQTYYAHQKNSNGSVAVRQSWDSGQSFSIWRVLDPVGSVSITGAVSGSASFDNSGNITINTSLNNFSSYKSENGYKYLGDGTILQWGRIDSDAAEKNVTVTFPITFPNSCLNISMTRLSAYSTSATSEADGDALVVEGTITNYSFVANLQRFNTSTSMLRGAMWFAIGH